MKILTGIVTFNPDINRLKDNLMAIVSQDTDILVFDNGSENFKQVVELINGLGAQIISRKENRGIAYGLKEIMDYAIAKSYDWVLTLDQDSITNKCLIEEYKKYCNQPKVGALTCNIVDRNFIETPEEQVATIQTVQKCITSGCFTRVAAYSNTPGYDVSMFIDYVDFDICYALRRAGYDIVKIPFAGLLHEDGHGENVKLFGRKYIMYHKSAWRRYFMTRNEMYLARKFPEYQSPFNTLLRCLWIILLILIFEDDKFNKLSKGMQGLFKGIIMKVPQF